MMEAIERRRRVVQSILSPPTALLGDRRGGGGVVGRQKDEHPSPKETTDAVCCSLCGYGDSEDKLDGVTSEIVRTMMGLNLREKEELVFCPFCDSQLQNLLRLKRDIDRLEERLSTMLLGLRSVFFMSRTQEENPTVLDPCDESNVKPVVTVLLGEVDIEDRSSCPPRTLSAVDDHGVDDKDRDFAKTGKIAKNEPNDDDIRKEYFDSDDGDDDDEYVPSETGSWSSNDNFIKKSDKEPKATTCRVSNNNLSMAKLKNRFSYSVCSKAFGCPHEFRRHTIVHTKEQPYHCPRPHCHMRFTLKFSLNRHLRTAHPDVQHHQGNLKPSPTNKTPTKNKQKEKGKPCKCQLCPKSFKMKHQLSRHVQMTHVPPEERPFPCPLCPRTFAVKYQLTRHAFIHQKPDKKHRKCDDCHKTFLPSSSGGGVDISAD